MARARLEPFEPMLPPLAFHHPEEHQASPERLAELLLEAKSALQRWGMASMEEYGDMLKWGLPKGDGGWRNIHVYHPDWCSFSDAYWGTIHYHGGRIRGTVLLGQMEHYTYEATQDPQGDRFHEGETYTLARHAHLQKAGTAYELKAMVPHWLKPTELTLTYFEEEDTDVVSDLVNPADRTTDDHRWTQAQADALLPELLAQIEQRLATLSVTA